MSSKDLLLAVRTLFRSPVFTLSVMLTLAIGVGATTAIFSVANAVLLKPLPYQDPDELVVLYTDMRARNSRGTPFSNENFVDIREGTTAVFDAMTAVQTVRQVLPGRDGSPEQIRLGIVTPNFFQVLGVPVARGRDFETADGIPQAPQQPQGAGPGGAPGQPGQPAAQQAPPPPPPPNAVILSHEYWQRRYNGDEKIVGQRLPVGNFEIVGVLSPGFELLFPPQDNMEAKPDVFVANRINYNNANRNTFGIRPIGRLKPGVTVAQAQDAVEAISANIRRDFVIYGTGNYYARVEPMNGALVGDVRPAILALMGAGLFLLLIACANIANLIVVRAGSRQTEVAVRSALGASKWWLLKPMIAEALILSVAGVLGGVAIAWAGVPALLAVAPANLPRLNAVTIDWAVLGFAALCGVVAALVFAVAPALASLRASASDALRSSGRAPGLGRSGGWRSAVVAVEVALCFVLLVGSGLMVRSFMALQRIDIGYNPENVLTFRILGGQGVAADQRLAIMRQLEEKLGALPGVTAATASFPFPLAGDFSTIRWGLEDALADNSKYQAVDWQRVIPGYFEAMGTRLLEGRTFTEADNQSRAAVVVVDQMLAAKAFPAQSAVGKRILIRIRTPEPEWVEIIGVVAHQRLTTIADPGREQVYFTDGFLNFGGARKWALRVASGDPAALEAAVKSTVASIDSQYLVTEVTPFENLVYRASAGTRFQLLLVTLLAVVAAILVAVGLYGVLSTMVRQRTAEIGVRMALGASPSGILGLVVRHGLKLSVIGLAVGLASAIGLTRLMRSMLVGVAPNDPATYAMMTGLFLVIAALAAWLPARRAAALDPTLALRGDL